MITQIVSITPTAQPDRRVTIGPRMEFRTLINFGTRECFALQVGEEGRGRVRRFVPILNAPPVLNAKVHFVRLRQSRTGWIGEVVEGSEALDGTLVLLNTAGGYRGDTGLPQIMGDARIIETGWYAQGMAGRVGRHPAIMVLATGPARIEWYRSGRLYGAPANWVAWTQDGITWHATPREDYDVACDIGIVPEVVMQLKQSQA